MLLPQTLTAAIALTMFAVIAFRMEANTEGFVFSFFSLFAWIALVSEFFLLYDSIHRHMAFQRPLCHSSHMVSPFPAVVFHAYSR